jgi:superfamily II DNA or RNA helicase
MNTTFTDREGRSSAPEDIFVELFAQVFGLEKVQMLLHDYPVEDIYGNGRFIDYAIRTPDERIAFEIDGVTWHVPGAISIEKYEDDLLRQNSLVHGNWRVFRWTDRELVTEPERVKEQLALFLEAVPGLLSLDEFLPKQFGETLELRPHQEEAMLSLASMREEGKTIALLTHAQGAGKTIVAVSDAKRLGGKTLVLAHRRELVLQAYEKLKELWPEVSTGLYLGDIRDSDTHNLAGSIQSVSEHLRDFPATRFDYVVIDEAHHAAAPTYRRVLGHFRAGFILGLTATPDRADGQSILELFRDYAHRLTLREAIERGELVPIRCVRVVTNVDLSKVRFNQVQYNRRDIEETVLVPSRDRLIVDTYLQHVRGRKAVLFCVNVRHGEALAELFRLSGIPSRSVSGRMSQKEREESLQAFHAGDVRVLCACDILNEGWDCPDVEVLLMARPTLSKVVYLQQLGRGTRKAPGKECLIVFDFVENATRYNAPLSLHRVAGETKYRPGGLVFAPEDLRRAEDEAVGRGERPTTVIEIGLWAREYQQVDLFNWQEAVVDMIPLTELEVELAAAEGTVRRAVDHGVVFPDHTLTLGDRVYHYFLRDNIDRIRETLGLPKVVDENIKHLFLAFVGEMDMAASYKPVLLLALVETVDDRGRAKVSDVVHRFRAFYEERKAKGLTIERESARMAPVESLSDSDVQRIMLGMPFEKFERRRYLRYDRDLAFVRFDPALWGQLGANDIQSVREVCERSIESYYERLS